MSSFYQKADADFIDYHLKEIPGIRGNWRITSSVDELNNGEYAVCIGAAQTFGRFCEDPYSELLAKALGIPVLNLGMGGAGPSNFYSKSIIDLINRSAFCVVQVMSGRSSPNFYFNSLTGKNAFGLDKGCLGPAAFAEKCSQHCIENYDTSFIKNFVLEMRRAWLEQMNLLSRKIEAPKILFWFSDRSPAYTMGEGSVHELGSSYPQFIDEETLHQAIPYFDHYVECVSTAGRPHHLYKDGQIVELDMGNTHSTKENKYYPTPEMHTMAKQELLLVCLELTQANSLPIQKKQSFGYLNNIYRDSLDCIKPNFLIVGAAKSGTSAISVQLNTHPQVFIPPKKELHFFDRLQDDPLVAEKQWKEYLTYFSGSQNFAARGEATVAYTMCTYINKNIPKLIYDYLGRIRIIYIVRHPFDRIVSQWRHMKRDNFNAPGLEEILLDENQRGLWLDRSNYWLQIQGYREIFGDENILVEFYEDYACNFKATLDRIVEFLELDPSVMPPVENVEVNKTSEQKVAKPKYSESFRADVMHQLKPDLDNFFNWLSKPNIYS